MKKIHWIIVAVILIVGISAFASRIFTRAQENAVTVEIGENVQVNGIEMLPEKERNENVAIAALKSIVVYSISKAKGYKDAALDPKIADATTPEKAYYGYYFIEGHSTALPAEYPKSGKYTFVLLNDNKVYRKDTQGKDPGAIPPERPGWELCP